MKAIKIDVLKKEIYPIEIDENDQLHSMYRAMDCEMIEGVYAISERLPHTSKVTTNVQMKKP